MAHAVEKEVRGMAASSGSFSAHESSREMAASSGGVSAPESSHAGPEACSQEKAALAEMKKLDTRLVERGLRGFFHEYAHRMVGRRRSVTQRGRLHDSVGQG